MLKIRTNSVLLLFFIVFTNRRVFLLCDFIDSSPPWNHVHYKGLIRVDERYVLFYWLRSNLESRARSGVGTEVLMKRITLALFLKVLQLNHFVYLSNSERRLNFWI